MRISSHQVLHGSKMMMPLLAVNMGNYREEIVLGLRGQHSRHMPTSLLSYELPAFPALPVNNIPKMQQKRS